MISLVMALLSKDTSSEAVANERTASWQRQIQRAQADLDEGRRFQSTLLAGAPDASNRMALATQLDEFTKSIDADRSAAQSNSTRVASLPAGEMPSIEDLSKRQATLAAQVSELTNHLSRIKQTHSRQLHLPREHATGKKPFYFIVRYGRVYPIHVLKNGQRALNTETIDWSDQPEGHIAKPRRDAASTADIPPLANQLRDIPATIYSIHFLVYDDSFPAFLAARQLPLQAGFDTGWEFLTSDHPVVFSSGGEAPPSL